FEDAIEATAMACGGKKNFACAMRPELAHDPDAAGKWLSDALRPDRREAVHAVHLLRALKEAGRHGCHTLKYWLDEHVGYQPSDIAPAKTPAQLLAEQMEHHLREFRRLADEHAAALSASELRAVK